MTPSRRTIYVFGGSKGIGGGIAEALAEAGWDVVSFSRNPPSDGRIRHVPIDFSDQAAARALVRASVARDRNALLGFFYSAVHYGSGRADFLAGDPELWRLSIDVNLNGLAIALGEIGPALVGRETPGFVCGVSSEVAYNAGPGRAAYAASKAGAASLLRSFSQEIDAAETIVVQIMPEGMVDTPGIRRRRPRDFDYSHYASPGSFGRFACHLAETLSAGDHGAEYVISTDGHWRHVARGVPASQSRRSA